MGILATYPNRSISISHGDGPYLYDNQGRRYIDCLSNYGVNILGYNHPRIRNVLASWDGIINLHGSLQSAERERYAAALLAKAPRGLNHVYFCNSGSEAIDAAIQLAKRASGRTEILAATLGYHGKSLAEKNASFLFNDANDARAKISDRTAAVLLELIQGEGGIRPADKDFVSEVVRLCTIHGAQLIVDEVQTGMGRTGSLFACEHYSIAPDLLVLSKGIAAGYPFAAVLINQQTAQDVPKGFLTNTFGGGPLGCRLASEVLRIIDDEQLLPRIADNGQYLLNSLAALTSPRIREVRGLGLMIGVDCREKVTRLVQSLQQRGVIAGLATSTVVRFLPTAYASPQDLDGVVAAFSDALAEKFQ